MLTNDRLAEYQMIRMTVAKYPLTTCFSSEHHPKLPKGHSRNHEIPGIEWNSSKGDHSRPVTNIAVIYPAKGYD